MEAIMLASDTSRAVPVCRAVDTTRVLSSVVPRGMGTRFPGGRAWKEQAGMSGGFQRKPGGSNLVQRTLEGGDPGTLGKCTLTAQLSTVPQMGRSGAAQHQGTARSDVSSRVHGEDVDEVHDAAEAGVSGPGGALPHADKIQAAFGPAHDVTSIRAHVGGAAEAATARMGAEAYATGSQIAFGTSPSLHTAATKPRT